jgi:zinc protease
LHFGSLVRADRSFVYDPGVAVFSLPNGLTVALVPDDRANLVSVDVRYLVGAADDPPGKAGLAHLVEHLMFGQRAQPGGATLGDRLTGVTLGYNASTSLDATHYTELALAGTLDDLLAIEATRMAVGCHGIDQPTFEREVAVVLQEYAQRASTDFFHTLHHEVFGSSHAYTRGTAVRDTPALTLADACSFIDAYYAPARAILVVGGRINRDAHRRPADPADRRGQRDPRGFPGCGHGDGVLCRPTVGQPGGDR